MAKDFDRILKENIVEVLLPLSRKLLGFEVANTRDLDTKLQKTIEREPDFLRVIETDLGEEFILHLEFQVRNDPNMLERMRTYHTLLLEKYRLPVRQFVLYLGASRMTMRTQLPPEEVFTGFELLDLHRTDVEIFLASEVPEEIILGVLADFGDRDATMVVRQILEKLRDLGREEYELRKWVKQLQVLSRIPNLENTLSETLDIMPFSIDITQDGLFKKGKAEGREEKGVEVAVSMLSIGKYTLEEIAKVTGLTLKRIQELKNRLI